MSVTKIAEFRSKETVAVLEELLADARLGKITGFAFACKYGEKNHGIGLTGDYRKDPIEVLAVHGRIQHVLNTLVDSRRSRL